MSVTHTTARQRWTALVLLAAVEFMILLDTAIVNIATPAVQAGLHLSEAELRQQPAAGRLLALYPGVRGIADSVFLG